MSTGYTTTSYLVLATLSNDTNSTFLNLTTMGNYVSSVGDMSDLKKFDLWYKPIHGYLAAIICIFGVVANILNIVVLTRKNMQTSTNVILTGLAISDGLTMAMYFPYALWMYVVHGTGVSTQRDTLACARFQMTYAIFSVIVHSISIWLTVTLAVFRFIFIRYPRRGARYCNIKKAKLAVVMVVIVVVIVCIPNSVNYAVIKGEASEDPEARRRGINGTIYWVGPKKNNSFEEFFFKFNFWVQALLVKLLPCLMLSVFSILLVKTMRDAEKRRKMLLNKSCTSDGESGATSSGGGNSKSKKKSRSNRTTKMLLTVVVLFIVTETPQGILSVLSSLIDGFFTDVYMPLGDLLDILALTNNGINFVLYCTMSKQFRDTFFKIFLRGSDDDGYRRKTTTTYITSSQPVGHTKDSDV